MNPKSDTPDTDLANLTSPEDQFRRLLDDENVDTFRIQQGLLNSFAAVSPEALELMSLYLWGSCSNIYDPFGDGSNFSTDLFPPNYPDFDSPVDVPISPRGHLPPDHPAPEFQAPHLRSKANDGSSSIKDDHFSNNDGSSSIRDSLPQDNDPAREFRESLFSFGVESKSTELSTGTTNVELVSTDKLESQSYSIDNFLDDVDESRGNPSLRRSACEGWKIWIPSDTRIYEEFMRDFSFWDDMAAALIHPLEIKSGVHDLSDRALIPIVHCRAKAKSNMNCGHLDCSREGIASVSLKPPPITGTKPDYKGVPIAYCEEHFFIALDLSVYKNLIGD